MVRIETIGAHEILGSHDNPTAEVKVMLEDGTLSCASVPSGVSTGAFEAVEHRDGNKGRYLGKDVQDAVDAVTDVITPELIDENVPDRRHIDEAILNLDGTDNKGHLGASTILGVSLAVARATADSAGLPLYHYLGDPSARVLSAPMMNILNDGSHADTNADTQEFMIAPIDAPTFREALRWGAEIYHTLKSAIKGRGLSTGLGDEGGFAPNLDSSAAALDLIIEAIEEADFRPGRDISLTLDVASSGFFKDGLYQFEGEGRSADYMISYYEKFISSYPLVPIEGPLSEDEWGVWKAFTAKIGNRVQLAGNGLFVTNPAHLHKGIEFGVANALLVRINQIGSLTEILDAVEEAHRNGYRSMTSYRSGKTEDTMIADLAVAINSDQIKTGAPAHSKRVTKCNQLLHIEEEPGDSTVYAGASSFPHTSFWDARV